ncbi:MULTISPECIES: sulfate ABC transporter permease subunit CysT [Clostridium]|uniref:Sulfate transport system permease protein CysT n=1 Tax=Clostridium intestinale DSM 6191 TaxID=1121320 RepID=A0A1M5YXG3_9CLOT|nr:MULTISPECIES: sulfate ABC transporter permease subunit CysT [Clostridium]SHI16736.1 sulfate transport system permease protein [Clostridium intestinale DSM 6191]
MSLKAKSIKLKQQSILPGFNLTLGFTVLYISLLVLIPVSMIFFDSSSLGLKGFIESATSERVLAAYKLSFGTSLAAGIINTIFGVIIAWVLVRYDFPGRKLIDGIVDLPFALPTAVAGIALTTLYAENGWIGKFLTPLGIKVSFTPLGIIVALTFIGLPFVVRTVQPVLINLEREVEEAAASLGANRLITFIKIILPEITPALITGFSLAFSRALGEYGSVVFISGNMPMRTEIAPLLIRTKLEQYDYAGGSAIAAVLLITSFFILLLINIFQWWNSKRYSRV